MVFYRKYRPQKFSEIIGQENIVKTILAQLTTGKIAHGYLFAGPKGTGKTSTARIFAKAVNCQRIASSESGSSKKNLDARRYSLVTKFGEPCNKCQSCIAVADGSHLDLIEIDAASNRGIDEIRDLREKVKLSPVSGRFKVYIIDEVHMLTTEAFNALLKTLEEPPAHVIFILCTTSPTKLPPTIISRLLRFNFRRASDDFIVSNLARIAKVEKISIDRQALATIAKISDGSFRDAQSILDQLSPLGKKITAGEVDKIASVFHEDVGLNFLKDLVNKDLKSSLSTIEKLADGDVDLSIFTSEVILLLEKILLLKMGISEGLDSDLKVRLGEVALLWAYSDIQNLMKLLLIAEGEMKIYPLPKISLILAICKFCPEPATLPRPFREKAGQAQSAQSGHENTKKSEIVRNIAKEHGNTKKPEMAQSAQRAGRKKVKSIGEIEPKWTQFLEKLKPVNAHVVALLRSTRPTSFDGVNLTIDVFYRFHKEKLEEPKIAKMIDSLLGDVMGESVKLKLNLANRETKPPKVVRESDVVEPTNEDLSRIAQEIFSK